MIRFVWFSLLLVISRGQGFLVISKKPKGGKSQSPECEVEDSSNQQVASITELREKALQALRVELIRTLNEVDKNEEQYTDDLLNLFSENFNITDTIQAYDRDTLSRVGGPNGASLDPFTAISLLANKWRQLQLTGTGQVEISTDDAGLVAEIIGPTHMCIIFFSVEISDEDLYTEDFQSPGSQQKAGKKTRSIKAAAGSKPPKKKKPSKQGKQSKSFCRLMKGYEKFKEMCENNDVAAILEAKRDPENAGLIEAAKNSPRPKKPRRSKQEVRRMVAQLGKQWCDDNPDNGEQGCTDQQYNKVYKKLQSEARLLPEANDTLTGLGKGEEAVAAFCTKRGGTSIPDPTFNTDESGGYFGANLVSYMNCICDGKNLDDTTCSEEGMLAMDALTEAMNGYAEGVDKAIQVGRRLLAAKKPGFEFDDETLTFSLEFDFGVVACSASIGPFTDAFADGCSPDFSCSGAGGVFTVSGSVCVDKGNPVITLSLEACNPTLVKLDELLEEETGYTLDDFKIPTCLVLGTATYFHGIQTLFVELGPDFDLLVFKIKIDIDLTFWLKGEPDYSAFEIDDSIPSSYSCKDSTQGPSYGPYLKKGKWDYAACLRECDLLPGCAYFDWAYSWQSYNDACRLYPPGSYGERSTSLRKICSKNAHCMNNKQDAAIQEGDPDCGGPNCAPCMTTLTFVPGPKGSQYCPIGTEYATSSECSSSGKIIGSALWQPPYEKTQSLSNYPKGCFWQDNNKLYYNSHGTGAAAASAMPYCASRGQATDSSYWTCKTGQGPAGQTLVDQDGYVMQANINTLQGCMNWCWTYPWGKCAGFDFYPIDQEKSCRLYGAIAAQTPRTDGPRVWCSLKPSFPNSPSADFYFGVGISVFNPTSLSYSSLWDWDSFLTWKL